MGAIQVNVHSKTNIFFLKEEPRSKGHIDAYTNIQASHRTFPVSEGVQWEFVMDIHMYYDAEPQFYDEHSHKIPKKSV